MLSGDVTASERLQRSRRAERIGWAILLVGVFVVGAYRQRASPPLRHVAARLLVASLRMRYRSHLQSQPFVILVFRPSDCPGSVSYLDAVLQWSAAKGARVRGVVVGTRTDLEEVHMLLRREKLPLQIEPISAVDASLLLWRAGIRGLPAAVVLTKKATPRGVTLSELTATSSR